ncbi:hypothetical protein [Burkholderia sp. L27(2015)]|uniref:hypothetical protein n=1 Tax=Burkholderia sp. L27(2015) TaxID=1641858 RepID=UPI0020B149A6|nr:hypothetical protein [Burkholderia sp. L27(2015)]
MQTVDPKAVVASSTAPQMAKAQAESPLNGKVSPTSAAARKVKAAKPAAVKKEVSAKATTPVKKAATAKNADSTKKVAAVKKAPTPKPATAAGDATKKSTVAAKAPVAKKVDAAKAVSAKSKDAAPKDDKKKKKVVRDSFTMPESDYQRIAELKRKCMSAGISAKKSELLRAGLQALSALPIKRLIEVVAAVENLKTGRPGKVE